MKRDVEALTRRTFDVLVVGGGIYGLTIAYDAAQRGLTVALIERHDFGSGASFNHLRTIHGGLRYLQTLDLARARESLRERRTFARIAPEAVRPLQFVLPLERSLLRGPMALRLGFLLDQAVGLDRNAGVPRSHRLPPGRVAGREAIWYDYETIEADRLTLSFALAAATHGAMLANYVAADALILDGRRIAGIRARDVETGAALEIAAHLTINATGGAAGRLLRDLPGAPQRQMPMLKAMNLVTAREGGEVARGGRATMGRNLFRVPWRGRAVFGTWESDRLCQDEENGAGPADIRAFLAELNDAFPDERLTMEDVTLVHRGIVPARVAGTRVALEGHERIVDHGRDGVPGLLTVNGAKYTTARAVAERVVTRTLALLGRPAVPCRTAATPLPGGGVPPASGDPLRWAVREEMARTLADVVIRRTPLGAVECPGDARLDAAAHTVADEAGWTGERTRVEVEAVRRFYDWA